MKIFKYLSLVLVAALAFSCTKHDIEYNATPIADQAEFQLHYFVPVTALATNNINRVLINNQLYATRKAPLSTYNAIPSGAVGRFFTINPGTVNIKMYTGATDTTLKRVYDKDVTLTAGKQNIFIHDTLMAPVVFNNGYPYPRNVAGITDSICWIKFYNFLYETAGVPSTLKLQYQYIDYRSTLTPTTVAVNIGQPVAFGEATDWQPIIVVKDNLISAGSRTMTLKIKTVDANGNIIGDLSIMGTTGLYSAYTATSSLVIGRRYHHIMAGFRAVASPNSSVRVFTAL